MMRFVRRAAWLLLLASAVHAQPLRFGDPFPLTETRQRAYGKDARLVAAGSELFLFWSTEEQVMVTALGGDEKRPGRAVLPVDQGPRLLRPEWGSQPNFDVVWTGQHFLIAGWRAGSPSRLMGRLLDRNAEPAGEPFLIASDDEGRILVPRLAFNGSSVLLAMWLEQGIVFTQTLTPGGKKMGELRSLGASSDVAPALVTNGEGFALLISSSSWAARLLMLDAAGGVLTTTRIGDPVSWVSGSLALAAGPGNYLAVLCGRESEATVVSAQGSVSARIPLNAWSAGCVAAWNGDGWNLGAAYPETHPTSPASWVSFYTADAAGEHVSFEIGPGSGFTSMIAFDGKVFAAWRSTRKTALAPGGIYTGALPLSRNEYGLSSWAVAGQELLATASSPFGALVVWQEREHDKVAIHAGIRARDGSWSENEITSLSEPVRAAAAAGDTEYVVALTGSRETVVVRVNADARPAGNPAFLKGFLASAIAFNGTNYALASTDPSYGTTIFLLNPEAVEVKRTVLPRYAGLRSVLASNGNGFYFAWTGQDSYPTGQRTRQLRGIRIGNDLEPIDYSPLVLETEEVDGDPSLAWDGTRYVIAWTVAGSLRSAHIHPVETWQMQFRTLAHGIAGPPAVSALGNRAVVLWRSGGEDATHRIALFDAGGNVTSELAVPGTAPATTQGRPVALPGGRWMTIVSSASRLTATVSEPSTRRRSVR